jgi:hypothetical protein
MDTWYEDAQGNFIVDDDDDDALPQPGDGSLNFDDIFGIENEFFGPSKPSIVWDLPPTTPAAPHGGPEWFEHSGRLHPIAPPLPPPPAAAAAAAAAARPTRKHKHELKSKKKILKARAASGNSKLKPKKKALKARAVSGNSNSNSKMRSFVSAGSQMRA